MKVCFVFAHHKTQSKQQVNDSCSDLLHIYADHKCSFILVPCEPPHTNAVKLMCDEIKHWATTSLGIMFNRSDAFLFRGRMSTHIVPLLVVRLLGKKSILQMEAEGAGITKNVKGGIAARVYKLIQNVSMKLASVVITNDLELAEKLNLPFAPLRYVPSYFEATVPYDDREPVVGYVGRLEPEKGIHRVLELARELELSDYMDGHPPTKIRLTQTKVMIIGDGTMMPWVLENKPDNVEVVGMVPRDKLPEYYNRMSCLYMPSDYEGGIPAAVLEAHYCGVPAHDKDLNPIEVCDLYRLDNIRSLHEAVLRGLL